MISDYSKCRLKVQYIPCMILSCTHRSSSSRRRPVSLTRDRHMFAEGCRFLSGEAMCMCNQPCAVSDTTKSEEGGRTTSNSSSGRVVWSNKADAAVFGGASPEGVSARPCRNLFFNAENKFQEPHMALTSRQVAGCCARE